MLQTQLVPHRPRAGPDDTQRQGYQTNRSNRFLSLNCLTIEAFKIFKVSDNKSMVDDLENDSYQL